MNEGTIDGLEKGARVVVAMSGGVDSSVAAALAARAGCEVVGMTLQLYDHGAASARKGACCAGQDIHDARAVADRLGIAHYVLDYERRFREAVIADFAASYAAGETPIPCVRCNQTVKFTDLMATARELGASALVTGHYARRIIGEEGPELHRAVERARDQSYFLFATTRAQLDYARFPLGSRPKATTRAMAEDLGLPVARKPDSQDICFVPQGRYTDIVRRLRPEADAPGEIVHVNGRVLGRHDGIVGFTVGQRRGLGIGGTETLFVIRIDAASRRVVVGPRPCLGRDRISLREANWLGGAARPAPTMSVTVKLRSTSEPVVAELALGIGGAAQVTFAEPQMGVAPGQACVFYAGERVLGGGWIAREATARAGAGMELANGSAA